MTRNIDVRITPAEHNKILQMLKQNRVSPLKWWDISHCCHRIDIDDYEYDYHIDIFLEESNYGTYRPHAVLARWNDYEEEWEAIDEDWTNVTDMCGTYLLVDGNENITFIINLYVDDIVESDYSADEGIEEEYL